MTVHYRPVKGYEGLYEVSNTGVVRSVDREITDSMGRPRKMLGRVLSQKQDEYLAVSLSKNGEEVTQTVHSLVARAFLGPRPAGMVVMHLDDNRWNNHADNLRYGTQKENAAKAKAKCRYGHVREPGTRCSQCRSERRRRLIQAAVD